MKIAIMGAGSTYTPELFEGLIKRGQELGVTEVVFEDIDRQRLDSVFAFCRRMASHMGAGFDMRSTLDQNDAVRGADFVVIQIRVGGQEGRHEDIMLGLRHGLVGQETTGVGGFAKAVRTIPQVLSIAHSIERLAPDAWVINFTNPSAIITEALQRHSRVKAIGLCNIPIDTQIEVAKALDCAVEDVELDYVGLNHLSWVREIRVRGQDRTEEVIEALSKGFGPANVPEADYGADFWQALHMIPSPYLRYFYLTDDMVRTLQQKTLTRAQEVMAIEAQLFEYYNDESTWEKPDLLNQRGGAWYSKIAVEVIAALMGEQPRPLIVNTAQAGTVDQMPADAVMELTCNVSRHGVVPRPVGEIQEEIFGLVRQVKAYERLTIEAAVMHSRDKALMALMANPLVRTLPLARAVLNKLIQQGRFQVE